MEAMLQQDLIDSVWRRRLFHYICLLILLIFFSHWMFLALHGCTSKALKHLWSESAGRDPKRIKGIYLIGKKDSIHIYPAVHQQALSLLNIQSGFTVTGLVPLLLERVFSKFQKILTPPSISYSNQSTQSFGVGKTPVNLHQLEHQKKKITSFKQHINVVSPSVMDKAIKKVIKGVEMIIQNALLL